MLAMLSVEDPCGVQNKTEWQTRKDLSNVPTSSTRGRTEEISRSDNDKSNDDELGVLGLEEFLNVLTQQDDNLELEKNG
jgi:hypothetical protein